MKLKTLVGTLAVLGLASSVVFAAPPVQAPGDAATAFWANIMNRNQDNAAGVLELQPGQQKITGAIATDLKYNDKRTAYTDDKGSNSISLHTAELYYDNQINNWLGAHVAVDYDSDFVGSNSRTTDMFMTEAYATIMQNDLYAKLGRQYLNFGSTMHSSITTPVTDLMTSTNATAVTLGALNLNGFYVNGSVFNGTPYGYNQVTTQDSDTQNTANQIHGYTAEVGFAQQLANVSYDVYADYIANSNDTMISQFNRSSAGTTTITPGTIILTPHNAIPAYAVHADVTTGPFAVMADYTSTTKKTDPAQIAFNSSGAQPSAYSMEADYNFMTNQYNSMVFVGYEGTQQALGIIPTGSSDTFSLPKTRMLLGYGVSFNANIGAKLEYANDKDYSTGDVTTVPGASKTIPGSGKSDNRVTARLTVNF